MLLIVLGRDLRGKVEGSRPNESRIKSELVIKNEGEASWELLVQRNHHNPFKSCIVVEFIPDESDGSVSVIGNENESLCFEAVVELIQAHLGCVKDQQVVGEVSETIEVAVEAGFSKSVIVEVNRHGKPFALDHGAVGMLYP